VVFPDDGPWVASAPATRRMMEKISGHRTDRLAKACEGDFEQGCADHGEGEELRPDDAQARRAIQNALCQHDQVSGGRSQHNLLHPPGHALARGQTAGEHLQRQQHQYETGNGDATSY
jgi:hypothetical protein